MILLFLTGTFLSNYADHSNLKSIGKSRDIIKNLLRKDFRSLTEWFSENYNGIIPKKMSLRVHQ